ncbi:hypothetical protein PRJ39_06185 [Lysobacter enzymogenes]|uniref:hypothetical protein n=1 Tax=Lysobacter enzymogenes TaxID=69 RepID=UPI003749BA18
MDFTLEMEKLAAEFEQEHGALPLVTRLEELDRGYRLWLAIGGRELAEPRRFAEYLGRRGYVPCRMAQDDTLAFFRVPPDPSTIAFTPVPKNIVVAQE